MMSRQQHTLACAEQQSCSCYCMWPQHAVRLMPRPPQPLPCCCAGEQRCNCYCMRKGLIRKAHLCHNLKKWAAKHPHGRVAAGVPETFIFELDDIDYIEEALCDVPEVSSLQVL